VKPSYLHHVRRNGFDPIQEEFSQEGNGDLSMTLTTPKSFFDPTPRTPTDKPVTLICPNPGRVNFVKSISNGDFDAMGLQRTTAIEHEKKSLDLVDHILKKSQNGIKLD
jgi:hypothetical protein